MIFALLMERNSSPVRTLIDINPAKQGKFVAATGLQVCAPEQVLPSLPPKSPIYVMNSNYMDEIMQMTHNAYTYIGVDHE